MDVNNEIQIVTEPVKSTACPKCGALLDVSTRQAFSGIKCAACHFEFVVPARFGGFLLLQLLGMGGMGSVYRARDEALNREVAIKVMQKRLGDDPVFVENFQREAQAAAKLNHPNIAQIYSFGQALGQPYIVMELISGGSLDRMMADQGPLDPAVVFHVGLQIAEGLREAAEAGLVHGDVKPENILFDNEKNAKLLDFGLAAMNKSPTDEIWGTPFYIPPEKVKKQPTDFRSDIYSLGATLYHAIAGVPPFDGTDVSAVVKARFISDPVPMRNIRGSVVPEEVDAIILRMMAKEPSKRFPTYGSLLSDLRRFLAKAGPVNLAPASKKIMIKGKRPKAMTGVMNQSVVVPETSKSVKPKFTFSKAEPVDSSQPLNKLEEEFAEIIAQKRKAKKMLSLIIIGVCVAISVIIATIFIAVSQIERKKQQREKEAIVKVQESANAAIVKAMNEARKFVGYIKESETQALKIANEAEEVVVAALGDEVRGRLKPPEPAYVVSPVEAEVAPAQATTNATPAQATTNAPSVGAKEGKEKSVVVSVDEEDEAFKTKYPVAKRVRAMYLEAYRVKSAFVLASTMLSDIEKRTVEAEKLKEPEAVKALQDTANAIVDKVKTMGYTRELTEVARNVSGLRKTLDSVRADVASLLAVRRQQEIDREKAEKREAEEAKKRKEEEELATKTKGDCGKVAEVEASNVALLKALKFRDAMRNLTRTADGITTKGGEEALSIARERIRRIEEVINHILNKAAGYKSPSGWLIEEADMKTLTVSGKKTTWADVFNNRTEVVNELINALVFNPEMAKTMRVRERTRLEVDAALCLWVYYRDIPEAVERAKQIAKKTAQEFSPDADSTKKLMPGVLD